MHNEVRQIFLKEFIDNGLDNFASGFLKNNFKFNKKNLYLISERFRN